MALAACAKDPPPEELTPDGDPAALVTGPVLLRDGELISQTGVNLRLQDAGLRKGDQRFASAEAAFADLLGVDGKADVALRKVTLEDMPPLRRDGGLCGDAKTTHLAIGRHDGMVRIAAFTGLSAPSPTATGVRLCDIYSYRRK